MGDTRPKAPTKPSDTEWIELQANVATFGSEKTLAALAAYRETERPFYDAAIQYYSAQVGVATDDRGDTVTVERAMSDLTFARQDALGRIDECESAMRGELAQLSAVGGGNPRLSPADPGGDCRREEYRPPWGCQNGPKWLDRLSSTTA